MIERAVLLVNRAPNTRIIGVVQHAFAMKTDGCTVQGMFGGGAASCPPCGVLEPFDVPVHEHVVRALYVDTGTAERFGRTGRGLTRRHDASSC